MMILFENVFLHEGHIALRSLSFVFDGSSFEGVEFDGVLEDLSNVKFTGISCLRLDRRQATNKFRYQMKLT